MVCAPPAARHWSRLPACARCCAGLAFATSWVCMVWAVCGCAGCKQHSISAARTQTSTSAAAWDRLAHAARTGVCLGYRCEKARISGLPDHQTGVGFGVGFLDFCCFSEEGYVLPLNDARSKIPSYVASGCAPLPGQRTSYTKHRQVALTSSGLTQQNARA